MTSEKIEFERKLAAFGIGRFAKDDKKLDTEDVSEAIPDWLVTSFGGVVGDYAAYINEVSPAYNPHTSFLGALAFCSFCASRRYRTESNLTPELYLVALCPSGGGKDTPRKCNMNLAFEIGARDNVVMDIASGEGGEDAIIDHAKMLAQIDEFDTLLRAIAEDRGGTKESLVRFLLQTYTSGGSFVKRRQKARGKDAVDSRAFCHRPGLTVFGTGIKSMFFSALNERAMCNGMFARMLVCPCMVRDSIRDIVYKEIPTPLVMRFQSIAGSEEVEVGKVKTVRLPDKPDVKPNPMIVPLADVAAKDKLAEITVKADEWYHSFPDTEDGEPGRAIANRRREHILRLGMVRAISRDPVSPAITADDLYWGETFVTWSQKAMLKAAGDYCYRNPFEEQTKKVLRLFKTRDSLSKRDIYRALRMKADEVDEVIETMVAAGDIALSSYGDRYEMSRDRH